MSEQPRCCPHRWLRAIEKGLLQLRENVMTKSVRVGLTTNHRDDVVASKSRLSSVLIGHSFGRKCLNNFPDRLSVATQLLLSEDTPPTGRQSGRMNCGR